jgi:serine/threonine protein kinase
VSAAWNPSRWLNVPRGSFKPAPGVLIAPHLQLVRPVTGAHELDVWVADQLILQIEVAVKFAPQEADGVATPAANTRPEPPGAVQRFLRQARCAAKIGDPHLVQVLEQGKAKGGIPFIVMELLEGLSLSQRLLTGPLGLSEARAVLNQAAGVLAKAHPLGLWHGSLCPEHLFASEAGAELFLKIANFGDVTGETWATDHASRLAPDVPSRKHGYLSPEQVQHGTGSSAAADLWALGVTLYELLTTTLPFEAATAAGINIAICNAQFSPPSHYRADLPPAVDAWFARVFAPQPSARLRDPLELVREFAQALGISQQELPGMVAAPPAIPSEDPEEQEPELEAELEGDGFEEGDERTIRWEAPSEWEPPNVTDDPGRLSRSPEAERISARPSSGPPPLPDGPTISHPPPPFPGYAPPLAVPAPRAPSFATGSAGGAPVAFVAHAMPGRSPIIGSPIISSPIIGSPATPGVAGMAHRRSATPVVVMEPSTEAQVFARRRPFTKVHGLIAGTLLGGIGALLAWRVQGVPESGRSTSEGRASTETRTAPLASADSAEARRHADLAHARGATRPGSRPSEGAENLVILQTDELPRAPDETADEEDGAGTRASLAAGTAAPATSGARSATKPSSAASSAASSFASAAAAFNARLEPGSTTAHTATKPRAPAAPARRETSHHSPKQGNRSANCNPPYFFDNNNIRRLKRECL